MKFGVKVMNIYLRTLHKVFLSQQLQNISTSVH